MTKRNIYAVGISAITILVSCNNQPASETSAPKADSSMAVRSSDTAAANLKKLSFDYAKDPACGMPLTAGVEDTAHYNGKLYGFCSKECKDAFMKDPASYTAKLK
jgi:YHS domain-containing protein